MRLSRIVILRNQPTVKCCSVMPQEESVSYEYSPEEAITLEEYNEWMEIIKPIEEGEDVDREHLECDGGACPIEYREDPGAVPTPVSD
jgi:ribonucleoside-triphosphate reductase (formate)